MQPHAVDPTDPEDWQQLAPILDKLVGRLSKPDREAILLRYYRDLPFAEVATQIGTTTEAARKRVDRAIEKLRRLAAEQGVGIFVPALAAHLSNFVKIPPPPGLVATATVTATAPAGSAMAASCANIVKGASIMMSSTKVTVTVAATILVLSSMVLGGIWAYSSSPRYGSPPISQPLARRDDKQSIPRLAPFSGIRWRKDIPEVQVDAIWYELRALDDLPASEIITNQKNTGDKNWKEHFGEDLMEILARMGRQPADTMNLTVRSLDANKAVTTLKDVPNTRENRQYLMVWPAPDQKSLFPAVRWQGDIAQVQINGTWYDLISIEKEKATKIVDFAKANYGPDWKKQFEENLTGILTSMGQRPDLVANLELHTLDSDELVTLSIRVPDATHN
jgi:hypothetical protein